MEARETGQVSPTPNFRRIGLRGSVNLKTFDQGLGLSIPRLSRSLTGHIYIYMMIGESQACSSRSTVQRCSRFFLACELGDVFIDGMQFGVRGWVAGDRAVPKLCSPTVQKQDVANRSGAFNQRLKAFYERIQKSDRNLLSANQQLKKALDGFRSR